MTVCFYITRCNLRKLRVGADLFYVTDEDVAFNLQRCASTYLTGFPASSLWLYQFRVLLIQVVEVANIS